MRRTAPFLLALVLFALALVGCGGETGEAGADPAEVVPRNAVMYAEVAVRPEGEAREGALAAAEKILDTGNPGQRIEELVDQLIAEADEKGEKATYADDIEPWLGRRAGLWIGEEIANDEDAVGLAIAVEDADAAQEFIDREGEPDSEGSHRGVEYGIDTKENVAFAIVEGRMLIGPERELKRMIDVAEGEAEALTGSKEYAKALEPLSDDRLGHFYMDFVRLIELAAKADPDAGVSAAMFKQFLGAQKLPPVAVGMLADGERVAFEAVGPVTKGASFFGGLTGLPNTESPLFGELPGDAWGAFAAPDFGKTAKAIFQQFAGALGGAAISSEVRRATGLDLERDVFSWMGDIAFYIRGETVEELEGALVIEATDDEAAQRAFGRIAAALASGGGAPQPVQIEGAQSAFALRDDELPQPIVLARAEGRVVAGLGSRATEDALSPDSRLADSDAVADAREALGDGLEPAFLMSVPPVLSLIEQAVGGNADFQEFKRYADAFTTMSVGSKIGDGKVRSVYAFGLE